MMAQMIVNKAADEVIAVVITFLHSHLQRVMGADTGLLQRTGFEFVAQKFVVKTLVDQNG